MSEPVTKYEIEAGARALRERMQAGRITRAWPDLPNSDKRKWREHAACVLRAARRVTMVEEAETAEVDYRLPPPPAGG